MITQGSNLPLYFSNIPISLDSIADVSAGIYTQKDGKELKHWGKDDLTITENGILAPISQSESMGLPVGFCYVELKFTDNSGMILPGIRVMEHVSRRDDKTELSGEQPQTLRYVDIDCSNVLTDVGAVVGASAYEVAVRNGFEGTEEEWLDSLVGGSGSGTASLADWVKQPEPPKYTAEDVGADTLGTADKLIKEHDESDTAHPAISQAIAKIAADVGGKEASGTAESKVSAHNTATDAHNDIRLLVQGLVERLNALADSDDTTLDQMSEFVAYIKSNKSLIDAITISKVSVTDIIDNLTTNVANKPLSAAQGVALKALIDAITTVELDETLTDNTKAAPADVVGKLKGDIGQLSEEMEQLKQGGTSSTGGGMNATAQSLLISILQNAVYESDQSAIILALKIALAEGGTSSGDDSGGDSGDSGETKYTVTSTCTYCTLESSATSITENGVYVGTITADDGYALSSVVVTMGGIDITSSAYSNGSISISKVTGDIVIVATAEKAPLSLEWEFGTRYLGGSGTKYTGQSGYATATVDVEEGQIISVSTLSISNANVCITCFNADGYVGGMERIYLNANESSSYDSSLTYTVPSGATQAYITVSVNGLRLEGESGNTNATTSERLNDVYIVNIL